MLSQSEWSRIYFAPLWLMVISITGLVLALLGDGLWDLGSWLLLSLVCLALVWRPLKRMLHR